jgi:transposase-like protein
MRPYLTGINLPAYGDNEGLGPFCPVCESDNIQYRGEVRNLTYTFRRFQCNECGKWGRDTKSVRKTQQVPL